jgi:putative peptidoglycan lipid II flippase
MSFDITNPAFREWVKLSVPLMLGVSLVTADDWILRHYASSGIGGIARLNYAKRLFAVPIAVLGQATGQASLPFFARLFNEKRLKEFADGERFGVPGLGGVVSGDGVDDGGGVAADRSGLSAWVSFFFRHADHGDLFFLVRAVAGVVGGAGLYARAFYAAGDTLTPMVAVSVITAASLPVYSILFRTYGLIGLAWASDIGIAVNLLALAWLLHRKKLVPLGGMRWRELGKAALTSIVAGGVSFAVAKAVPLSTAGRGSRSADIWQLAMVSLTWAGSRGRRTVAAAIGVAH